MHGMKLQGANIRSGGYRGSAAEAAQVRSAFLPQSGGGVASAALRHDVARTAFAGATAGGYAQLKLNVVEVHAGMSVAGNVAVGNTVANANNHGEIGRAHV